MDKFDVWLIRPTWHTPGDVRLYCEYLNHDTGQIILPFTLRGKDPGDLETVVRQALSSRGKQLDLDSIMLAVADHLDGEFGEAFSGQVYLHSEQVGWPDEINHRFIFNPFVDPPKLIDIRNRRNDR